jgi:hypothetical protein
MTDITLQIPPELEQQLRNVPKNAVNIPIHRSSWMQNGLQRSQNFRAQSHLEAAQDRF